MRHRPVFPSAAAAALLLVAALLHPAPLTAQGAGAIILQLNPSARAAGMGESGTAVAWGQAPNHWANPALLGYHRGLRWERADYTLVPDLAEGISYEAERATLGWRGLGLLLAGEPFSPPDGYRLDLGEQQGTDESGNPTGTFSSWMEARSWGLGVSLGGVLAGFAPGSDLAMLLSRHFDLAAGYVRKDFEDRLAPDEFTQDGSGGGAEASAYDYGFLVRISPVNTIPDPARPVSLARQPGHDPALDALCGGLRVDLTYGKAVLNAGDEWIVHGEPSQADPLPKAHRWGWAAHLQTGLPRDLRDGLRASGLGWLGRTLTPLLSFGYTQDEAEPGYHWDDDADAYVYDRDTTGRYDERYRGWEVGFANVLHFRRGHVEIAHGEIDGDTEGWSIGFELAGALGWRYDEATVPQADGLSDAERRSWTVYVDAFALDDLLWATR